MKKVRIKEHEGYYFSYDENDPSIPVTVHSNWRKTGQTPAVIDLTHSRPLKSADDRDRLYVTIATMGKKVRVYLDTLVASYLINNPRNYNRVIHKDNNIYNCHPTNLKWVSDGDYKLFAVNINRAKGRTKQYDMILSENFVRETTQHIHKTGYVQVNMKLPGEKKIVKKLHRLIAIQLIPNPDELETVDHIDCDKLNNHPSNLQWISNSDNVKKAFEDGRHQRGYYEITHKDGKVEVIENLVKYCEDENYNPTQCYNVINNKQQAHKDIIKIIKL
jgi:hypothetical protein